jgi:hypothetical protein
MVEGNKGIERLAGEASPGLHSFIDLDGSNTLGHQVIFPILKQVDEDRLELIGTGFFISVNGLFVSAKHVLRDPFDSAGNQKYPICMIHFLPDNSYKFRNILWCSSHNTADIAIGLAEPVENSETREPLRNAVLTLTTSAPALGETIITYAYPKHRIGNWERKQILEFHPSFYEGQILEPLPHGRGKLPGSGYQTNIHIHGGASGGPVVGKSSRVFAINCSSFDGAPDISSVSRIDEILALEIRDARLPDGQEIPSATIADLARAGWVDFDPPLS